MRKVALLAALAGSLWLAPGALAAGWCGSGETPADRADIVTGRQIHAVVAVPSDGADTFPTDAARLEDDVASLSAWWTGQDPTRVPRFDEAAFPGGPCLDISFLRLPDTGASLAGATVAFGRIEGALQGSGLLSSYKRYLVYYDGPSPETDVCGVGGGQFSSGPALAVVLLSGCPGVPTDSIAAHELLHALGAVPPGDPHACPEDPAHACDSPTDILYPFTHGEPLSQKVLDYGHDDYYGHSGPWDDIQDSLWLRHLDTPEQALGIAFTGSGAVFSDVPGVDCSADCTTQWDQGSSVTLATQAAPTDRFVGWRGACTGDGSCSVTLDQAMSVSAVFGPLRVAVKVTVAGRGRVACTPGCSTSFAAGDTLTLRAVPAKGWRFARWSGACLGSRLTCRPATDFAVTARATFRRR